MPLLEGLDGVEKMSKSKNNYIGISEEPNTMFAKVLSISDVLMWKWYTLLSFQSEAAIAALKAEVEGGRNPKDAKVALAKEITARFHSAAAANAAEQDFINRSKGGVPDEIAEVSLPLGEGGTAVGIAALAEVSQPGRLQRRRQPPDRWWRRARGQQCGQRQRAQAGCWHLRAAGRQAQVCACDAGMIAMVLVAACARPTSAEGIFATQWWDRFRRP
jgi:hypothetical protein